MTVPAGQAITPGLVVVEFVPDSAGTTSTSVVGADGTYRASSLAPGTYRVHFRPTAAANLLDQWWDGKSDRTWATTISLNAGQDVTGIDARLERGASVSGRVQLPAGVRDTAVSVGVVARGGAFGSVAQADVDRSGAYTVTGLRPGAYTVHFSPQDETLLTQWWKGTQTEESASFFTLTRGQALTGVDATLTLGATASGRVVVPADIDPSTVSVSAYDVAQPLSAVGWANVSADGVFTMPGLPSGTYKFVFEGASLVSQWWSGKTDFTSATAVELTAGRTRTGLNATLVSKASISGTVSLPAGVDQSAGSVTVQVYNAADPATVVAQAAIAADGTYVLTDLDAGAYKLSFVPQSAPVQGQWWKGGADFDAATTITLAAGQQLSGIDAILAQTSTITGRVTLPAGVELGAGSVTVTAYSKKNRAVTAGEAVVGADGGYRITGLSAGSYAVSFTPRDLPVLPEWWNDKPDFGRATAVKVAAGQVAGGIDATLARSATISGTVVLPTGTDPGTGTVTVRAYASVGVVAAETTIASDGRYILNGLAPGTYRVQFEADGIDAVSEFWNDASTFDSAKPVTLTSGQARTGIDATLASMASISGKVTVPQGVTVNAGDLAVTVTGAYGLPVLRTATVAADGTYTVPGLPSGQYTVKFSVGSLPLVEEWWNDKPTAAAATVLTLAAGERKTAVNAALASFASLSGRVSLPSGVSMSSGTVEVSVRPAGSTQDVVASAVVGSDGTYTLSRIPAGSYKVAFRAQGLPVIDQWWRGAADAASATPVKLTAGKARSGVDATLVRGASISGHVDLPVGIDAADGMLTAEVYDSASSDAPVASVAVGSSGDFRVTGIPAGSYKVHVSVVGIAVADEWWNDKSDFTAATPITVSAGKNAPIGPIVLAPLASISGTVSVPVGAGVGPNMVRVQLYNTLFPDRVLADAPVERDGSYALSGLRAGTYKVRFATQDAPLMEQWWKNRPDYGTATLLTLKAGQARTGVDATMSPGASISGTVKVPASAPLTSNGVTIEVRTARHELVKRAAVAPDGTYRVQGLTPGTYKVHFVASGNVLDEWWNDARDADDATPIVLTAGQVKTGIDASLLGGSTISGRVVLPEGVTMQGGAISVSVRDAGSGRWVGSTSVRSDGTYSVSPLPAGRYTISYSSWGLPIAPSWWWESAGDEAGARVLTLSAGQTRTRIDTVPPVGASLSGTATLPTGMKMEQAGLRVEVFSSQGSYVATTGVGPNGSWTVTDLPAGDYKVSYRSNSKVVADRWWRGQLSMPAATPITLRAGQKVTGIDETLVKAATITGRVTLPTGVRMTDGEVTVLVTSVSDPDVDSQTGRVSADGSYRISGLPAGSYRIAFEPRDLPVLPQWWDGASTYASAKTLTLAAGQTRTGVNASLPAAASISGRVTGPAGASLGQQRVQVEVYAAGSGGMLLKTATTQGDGSYTVTGLVAGSYKVKFVPSQGLLSEWWNDSADFTSAATITLASGQSRTGVNAALSAAALISGRVTLPDGVVKTTSSLSVAVVSATSEYSYAGFASVAEDGSYSLGNIAPGTYKVKFSAYDLPVVSEWWDDKPDFSSATTVTLKPGQKRTGIDATLATSATISGTVTLPTGVTSSQGGVSVSAYATTDPSRVVSSTVALSNGAYTLSGLTAGTYAVRFSSYSLPVMPEWWDDKPDFSSAKPVTLTAGQRREGVNATLTASPTISGTVTLPAGASTSGQSVTISAYSTDQYWSPKATATAAPDGTYTLKGLEPGTYKVKFSSASANVVAQWWNAAWDFDSATPLVLKAGQKRTKIDATLRAGASIAGTVTVPAGVRADAIWVSAVPASQESQTAVRAQVGADGRYTLTGLPAGAFKVQFSSYSAPIVDEWWNDKPDFARAQSVTVTAGQARKGVDAALASSGSISGTVTRAGGAPATGVSMQVYRRSDDGSWQYWSQTTTSDTGTYLFSRLTPGAYKLQARPRTGDLLPEYFPDKPSLETAKVITLTSGAGRNATANMSLAAGSTVSGTVRYADGTPMSDASVTILARTSSAVGWATTDANGRYTVTGVPPVEVTAAVRTGGGTIYAGSTNTLAGARFVSVTKASRIDVKVPGVTVSGTVRITGTRTPVTGGSVALSSPGGGYANSAVVGTDGRYTLRGVIAGSYTARFEPADGSGLATTWSGGGTESATAVYFGVAAAAVTKDLVAVPGGSVTAFLPSGPTSFPYRTAQLYRWEGGEARFVGSRYGLGGSSVRFDFLAPGSYTASVDGVYLGGAVTPASATRITVAAGKTVDIGTLDAEPRGTAGTLTVTVTGTSYGTDVVVIGSNGQVSNASRRTSTSSSTTSTFAVPVGTYRVFASSASPGVVDTWYGGTSSATATKITVSGGQSKTVSFALATGNGSLTGRVTDASTGRAIGSANVRLIALDRLAGMTGSVSIRTDAGGAFSLPSTLRGGASYRVEVSRSGDSVLASRTFTAKAGAQNVTLSVPQPAVLGGQVTDAVGKTPVTGVAVELWRDGETQPARVQYTDETGSYRFRDLAAGSYRVQFAQDDFSTPSSYAPGWAAAAPTREQATVIKVAAGATVTAPVTKLARAGTISGRVAAAPAKSNTRWTVAAVTVKDATGRLVAEGRSDGGSPGGYAIEAPPGTYTVCARPRETPPSVVETCRKGVVVTAGKLVSGIDLTMRPASSRSFASVGGGVAPW